ncbi:Uncharacterised protein [Yersinia enterocolitica]|nr:Uncharacterised protein [Yersinia enterocolitica]
MLQFRFAVVRPELPDNAPALLIDNGDDVRFARVPDNVIGMKTAIPRVKPLIMAECRHGIDVHPIAHSTPTGTHIGVIPDGRFSGIIEPQFIEMVATAPFPDNIPLPIHFNNGVIEQQFVRYFRIVEIGMRQNECVTAIYLRFQTGGIVADRITTALIIMMCARHPLRITFRIVDFFVLIELPCHIAFPVDLHQIDHILHAEAWISLCGMPQNRRSRKNFVGEAVQVRP